ncbi:MAG: iron ABC transporter substrate-binding protein [Myxococcales bacterium]|nr:iron ABC transporter substrate-binding protein [Myxococcales bacterium]
MTSRLCPHSEAPNSGFFALETAKDPNPKDLKMLFPQMILRRVPLLGIILALAACSKNETKPIKEPTDAVAATKNEQRDSITLYSGRSQVLIEPLLTEFTQRTGIKVDVRYDKSTQNLATRLLSEGAQSKADVFFAQDSGYLGALAKQNVLAQLPEALLALVPATHRDAQGKWIATSGRARVLVYDPSAVQPDDLPKTLSELTDSKWKDKLGWAPGNASFQAHVSALRHLWGEEKAAEWLSKIKDLNPKTYPKNSPQVKGVSNGEIQIGWVNHYYLHKLKAANPELKAANYSFSQAQDAGNVMMLSGIGIVSHSKKKEAAQKLVEHLLSEKSQQHFTTKIYEYPTRTGIKANAALPDISSLMSHVPQEHLADVGGTLKMLRDLKLQ